jgi:hypothetical protein
LELHRFVWESLNLDLSFHPYPNTNWRHYAPEVVATHAAQSLDHLNYLARAANDRAIRSYASLVCEHVKNLNSLIEDYSECLLPFSRKCLNWPVRHAKRAVFGDDAGAIFHKLQVGAQTIANDPNARFNPNGKYGKIAVDVLERIELCRNERPVLFALRQTTKAWEWSAKKLPAFPRRTDKPTPGDIDSRNKWLAVAEQVMEDDFQNTKRAEGYHRLMASNKRQDERYFIGKACATFQKLWDKDRKAMK